MRETYKIQHNLKTVFYALVTVFLLCVTIIFMVANVYYAYENEAFEMLHMETQQIKRDVNLQMYSDRENLITMANFASKLHSDGEGFQLLFRSFEEIGLFEDVRILMPDNSFITKNGVIPQTGVFDFSEEVKKGTYVSGRVKDIVNGGREVVCSAVPVQSDDGNTIAIIYGIINLQKFEDRYLDDVRAIGADVFIIEQENGNFIVDTKRENFGTVKELSTTKFEDGYSYDEMARNLSSGKNGFSSFDSIVNGKKLYAHYAPLDFAKWQIMLAKPASEVFKTARITGKYMLIMSAFLILIMFLYILVLFITERNNLNVSNNASVIRKSLLEVNQNFGKIYDALKIITKFSKAKATFFTDSYREDHIYTLPNTKAEYFEGDHREYFINELVSYVAKKQGKYGTNVYLSQIKADKNLSYVMPDFYEFLKKYGIETVHIGSVTHNNRNTSMLCVINSKKHQIGTLLSEIAICFSMAIYNKKHLIKTESMALTDALTGVANRMAYKEDVKELAIKHTERFTCIYIDVNELNYYNNNYGHAAGDQMLVYIAEALQKEFFDSRLYRMGGDEFLIFTEGLRREEISERLNRANSSIEEMKYHISIGIKKIEEKMTIEELVNEAEKRMYLEKAKYYQSNEKENLNNVDEDDIESIKTGIKEIDAYLEILENKYYGVYYVSLDKDEAKQITAPSVYFAINGKENKFSAVIKQYIRDNVKPEFHRTILNFIQYDILESQIKEGTVPKFSYVKKDGEKVLLSVWPVSDTYESGTIWVFEKDNRHK